MRRVIVLPILAAVLMPAPPAAAGQQPALNVREIRDVHEAREIARAATRYQGNRNQNRFEQVATEKRSLKIGAGGLIELRNIAGDIVVTAGRGDTATVDITKRARAASDADAREFLNLVRVEVVESAGRAEVRAVYPESRPRNQRRNFSVETVYHVTAPAGARIRTDSISGNITVSGIRGELTLGTISGNVTVRDAGQRIAGQSISGNVELMSAQDNAVVELSSTSGNVSASNVKVRRLELGTISGTVRGRDLQCEQASLHTMSGDVEYSGSLTSGGRYDFRTHSGDVRLTLGPSIGFELEASTFSGEVRSGLALRMEGQPGRRNRTVRGTFGDGRARIVAHSFSGDVIINGK